VWNNKKCFETETVVKKIHKFIIQEDFLNVNIKSKKFITLAANPREE
jgi:hypothetical protein